MGLDQYLYKKTYVKNWDHMKPEEQHEVIVKRGGEVLHDIKPERIGNVTEDVCKWRKFNALHKWFVENCQNGEDDCREYYVSREQLTELLEILNKVKEFKNDPTNKELENLLPTTSGFFFGGTAYDEYYFDEVERTIEMLSELLKEEGGDYYYDSSW
jgi:hypothetical protein